MNRSQTICHTVAGASDWVTFDAICTAVLKRGERDKRSLVSAHLGQLVIAGKLKRRGARLSFEYHATKSTLLDLRKVHPNGKPKNKSAIRRPASTPAPRKAAPIEHAPKAAPKPQAKPQQHQKLAVAKPAPASAPRSHERETVEQFLARGGRIQHLAPGESSETYALNAQVLNKRRKERLGITSPEPVTE